MAEIKLKIASVVIGSGNGGGSGVAPYYADLPDKPSINGKTLSGNKTAKDLGLASSEQVVPSGGTTGQVLTKRSNLSNDVEWAPSSGIIGANAKNLDAGSNATASIDEDHILQLGIPVGLNAVNPFKGWFTTDNIPTIGQEGDYCYVDDDGTTKVWRWNPNAEPPAFEETADTPDTDHTQTFASNESVNEVAIDGSKLVNPVNTADPNKPVLAKAEDVMQLKAKLEGVTASEVKVQLVTSEEGQNVYDGYINGNTGAYVQSIYNKFIVVPLNGAKSVRWLGKENTSNSLNLGWAFGTFSGEIDSTLSTFTALSNGMGVYNNNPSHNQAVEYIKKVPEGATHAVITIWIYNSGGGSAVTMDNFYCYLQSGESVGEELKGKVNVADMAEYASIVKNLFDEKQFIRNSWIYDGTGWHDDAGKAMSNKLYLKDGVTYTVNNIAVRTASGNKVRLVLFDKNDAYIDYIDYNANTYDDKEAGTGNWKKYGYATFTYSQIASVEYCRFVVIAYYGSGLAYPGESQLEVGSEKTQYAEYAEVMNYDLVKRSELSSLIQKQVQPFEDDIEERLAAVEGSLVAESWEGCGNPEIIERRFYNNVGETTPNGNSNTQVDILKYQYKEGKNYRFSGKQATEQSTYAIAYLDESGECIGLFNKGQVGIESVWEDVPLNIPSGTVYICLQRSRIYPTFWKLEKKVVEEFDFQEMNNNIAELKADADNLSEKVDSLSDKLMKVTIKDDTIIVRTSYSETDDFILVMKIYGLQGFSVRTSDSLTFSAYYIAPKNVSDDNAISSKYLIRDIHDSIGAIKVDGFYYLYGQHGYAILQSNNPTNGGLTSSDVGSVWIGYSSQTPATGRKFVLGYVESSYLYWVPLTDDSGDYPTATFEYEKNYRPIRFVYDSESQHPSSYTNDINTNTPNRYDVRVQKSERKHIVDGVEVGNGTFYCNDYCFDEFVLGINPAAVDDKTKWMNDLSSIDYSDENLLVKLGRSFVIKGMSVAYNCSINVMRAFKSDVFYGMIPQLPEPMIRNDKQYASYSFIPKAKREYGENPICHPLQRAYGGSHSDVVIRRRYNDEGVIDTDLYDINNVPDRCVCYLQAGDGSYLVGCGGGVSLVEGFTKKNERNNYLDDSSPVIDSNIQCATYDSIDSTTNKFYTHSYDGSSGAFTDSIIPISFVKDFCGYMSWFNPNDNPGMQVYSYKASDGYIVYIHAQALADKKEVNLPSYLEGMNVVETIEKTNGASLLTTKVTCGKIYVKFVANDGTSYSENDNYIVIKVK